jgi:hypothetical protein
MTRRKRTIGRMEWRWVEEKGGQLGQLLAKEAAAVLAAAGATKNQRKWGRKVCTGVNRK